MRWHLPEYVYYSDIDVDIGNSWDDLCFVMLLEGVEAHVNNEQPC